MNRGEKRQISEVDGDIEFSTLKRSKESVDYKKLFTFKGAGANKVGICKVCPDVQEIKMKLSNTSGLKRHLLRKHVEIYRTIFPDSDVSKDLFKKNTLNNYVVSQTILGNRYLCVYVWSLSFSDLHVHTSCV